MKTIYFSFLLFLSFSITQAQWTNQNPVPDGNDLWSTFFVDDNTGWIVGSAGFIKKTTNAGVDWIQQTSGTILTLKSVQFIDLNTGWICGEQGLILKTTNGGTTWFPLSSGTTEDLTDIHFCSYDIVYAVGYSGTILKTTDTGLVWTSLPSGTTFDLYGVDFVDANIGYAVGADGAYPKFLKTTDAGASWMDKSSGVPVSSGSCNTVEFINANLGFIGCGHILYKTTNGGDIWIQSPIAPLESKKLKQNKQLSSYPLNEEIHSIYFKDENNGWYADFRGWDNYIYTTTDGGISWEGERHYVERPILSILVTQDGNGFAVGSLGLMYLKADANSNWLQQLSGIRDGINSIYFVDRNIGWAGGTRWGNPTKSIILKTIDGGKQWKTQLEDYTSSYSRCFYFINESLGWLVKSNVIPPKEFNGAGINITTDEGENWISEISAEEVKSGADIFRTTDGGENWVPIYGGDFSSIFFINQDTGWVTSDYSYSTGIYKSTNGGVTLEKKSTASSSSIYFSDINTGWAVGSGGILKSTDGGETWIAKSSSTASYVRFYNPNIGMCVSSGAVLVSTDGGENWTTKSAPPLQTINFISPVTVWGYTSEGTLYKTTNLGDTWVTLNTGLGFGETAFFINEITGWVGGKSGTMFNYSVEPLIALTSPIGGEVWKSGWQRNITWTSENISNVNLYYSTNGGGDWNTIATNIDASNGSYNWTVPTLSWFINLHCKVKIEEVSNSSVYDESDNNFIIWHFCNIIQYSNLGQRIIDFLETNIHISMNVTTADNISVNYYPYETPNGGTLPTGVVVLSDYYWQISSPALSFSNGKMIVPISTLRGVNDPSKLVWLKRSNSGDPWENIGGTVVGENLESTVLFNSFSEFAIGSTDPANPLPVELSSFTAVSKPDQIILNWETETETNNYGFEIERKVSDQWQKIGFINGNGNSNSLKEYFYTDKNPIGGSKFEYRLKQIDNDGQFEYSKVVEVELVPNEFALYQNYPNPFNPTTTIRYQLPKESKVVIKIYNILGSEVMELLNEQKEAGIYEVEFNAETLSSGTYIYRIIADSFIETKKMILIK